MLLVLIGGVALALGLAWLIWEAVLHLMGSNGGTIVGWAGPWPKTAQEQKDINQRLAATQDKEFRALRRVRPIPISLIVVGFGLILVGAF